MAVFWYFLLQKIDLLNCGKVEMHGVYFFSNKTSVLAANKFEERTVERYPNRMVSHPKTLKRLAAN